MVGFLPPVLTHTDTRPFQDTELPKSQGWWVLQGWDEASKAHGFMELQVVRVHRGHMRVGDSLHEEPKVLCLPRPSPDSAVLFSCLEFCLAHSREFIY